MLKTAEDCHRARQDAIDSLNRNRGVLGLSDAALSQAIDDTKKYYDAILRSVKQ